MSSTSISIFQLLAMPVYLPPERAPSQQASAAFAALPSGDSPLGSLWGSVRRHRYLVMTCVIVTVAVVALYTSLTPRTYESVSVMRFEPDSVNLPQLVQQLATANRINTEIEVLNGRSAAEQVIDSLGLRAILQSPRSVRASSVFSFLQVAPTADTTTLLVHIDSGGKFTVAQPKTAGNIASGRVGDTVRVKGVAFALTSSASRVPALRIRVLSMNDAVRSFMSAVKVSRPSRDADLIDVKVQMRDPVLATASANALSQQLITGRQALQMARTGSAVEYLTAQMDTLGFQLHRAEDSLVNYRERAGVVDAPEQARTEVARLASIQADRGRIQAERDALRDLVQQMRHDSASSDATSLAPSSRLMAFPTLFSNQATAQLLAALASVENERSALLVRRKPEDPDVEVLTGRVREINDQLQSIAETYLQGLTNQAAGLDALADQFGTTLDSLPKEEVQAARLERGVTVLQGLYTLIQQRLKEAEITQAMKNPTVHIVDPAFVPDRPIRPKPLINMALAVVLGLMFGVCASVGRDLTNRSVRSRADAFAITGLPALGAVPRIEQFRLFTRSRRSSSQRRLKASPAEGRSTSAAMATENGGHESSESSEAGARIASVLVTRQDTFPAYVEAFTQLQINLALAHRGRPLKRVVITSPLPGEGKTLTAINFALTAARRGLRVLLIDGDLRRGLVNEVFRYPRGPGLSDLLRGASRFEDVTRRVSFDDANAMTIIPSGARLPTPASFQTTERMRAVLDDISPAFDLVVIDSPPINLLADAALLGSAADGVILVIRAGHTGTDALRYAMEQLTAANAPVVGTLLNDIDLRRHSGDDGSYRYLTEVELYYADRG